MKKEWFLDISKSSIPKKVKKEVSELWIKLEFGNDYYMLKTSIQCLEKTYDLIYLPKYLRKQGLTDRETVIINYWW